MHPSHRCSDDSSEEDGTSGEEDTHVSSRSVRTQSVHEERSARSDILESTSSSFAHVVPSKTVSISSTAVSNKGVAESGTSAQLPRKINVGDRIEVQDIGDAEW
jgi:septal ring-binding cell division protein DamX